MHYLQATFLLPAILASVSAVTNPIFIISNAEQPSLSRPGLTPVGIQRAAECLPDLFSTLNIGKIIMCPRNDDSEVCFETLSTTQPIADALGLPIDTSCGADENTDDDCVTDLTKKFAKNSTQSILIVWDIQEIGALLGEDLDLDTDDAGANDGQDYWRRVSELYKHRRYRPRNLQKVSQQALQEEEPKFCEDIEQGLMSRGINGN
ncbi:hypothetical protein B0H34DRAFT_677167 [Crassisporium funariophilum]|nr:hypothetical protein B0H34DRAFT_677167 [Crassisporium funariophilum]